MGLRLLGAALFGGGLTLLLMGVYLHGSMDIIIKAAGALSLLSGGWMAITSQRFAAKDQSR